MVALQLVLIAIATLCYFMFWRKPNKLPPGPRGLPLVGYTPFLGGNPAVTHVELGKKYGPLFSLQLGSKRWVVLNSYEVLHEAFVKRGHQFSGRPWNAIYEVFSGSGYGLTFRDFGERWRVQRDFCAKSLKRQGTGKLDFEAVIAEEARYLNEAFLSTGGKLFDPKVLLEKATANVTMCITIGSRMSYDDEDFSDMVHEMNGFATDPVDGALFGIMAFFPKARFLPRFRTTFKKFQYCQKHIGEILERFVVEHKATFDPENPRDFIDEFLKEKAQSKHEIYTDRQLIQALCELFQAGTGTTADTILWCFLVLAHFPECQDKIASEFDDVIGEGGTPSSKHKKMMPYTCAFLQESQRMFATAPISLPRKTTTDVHMRGYEIPKDTLVISNLYAVHYDPNNFEDPEVFRPERFLDTDGNFLPSNRVIPFSLGPRSCIGEQLARKELFIILVSILAEFRVERDSEKSIPPLNKGTFGLVYSPLLFEVRLVPK